MSYTLVISEVRQGVFEERNLDSIGFSALNGDDAYLLIPDRAYNVNEKFFNTVVKVGMDEESYLNPMNLVPALEKVFEKFGKPSFIVFTHSSSGVECASYVSGFFSFPVVTDVSGYDKDAKVLYKSYYSDKIFGGFTWEAGAPCVVTVRSGSFKDLLVEKTASPATEVIEGIALSEVRTFMGYVEEEAGEVDITKADFLVSLGRGIGNKDEIPKYEELVKSLKGVMSCSRPVVDKLWLPKGRQVGTSGKTVKPKVYFAMGISGAFQHIAGMKDSECIIAVNKDANAPIFQYAHYGVVGDIQKLRDKLIDVLKG
jgi:electron transfer flavoprotein alpha subunit